jgi:soluble lytic murein transglycosylase
MLRFLKSEILLICLTHIFLFPFAINAADTDKTDPVQNADALIKKAVVLIDGYQYRKAERILLDIAGSGLPGKNKAHFLLGELYKKEHAFSDAEGNFIKVSEEYPLLRDYALEGLADLYSRTEQYDKVIRTVRQIGSKLLLQDAEKSGIEALLALKKEKEAEKAFDGYIKKFQDDWDYKYKFALSLKDRGETGPAVRVFRDIYINVVPLSENALDELKLLKADTFSGEETLKRADNLYTNYNFREAETTYREMLDTVDNEKNKKIRFRIGMCQFRQKKYNESAVSFGFLGTPKAMYWQARSFYRVSDSENFSRIKDDFDRKYPHNKRLALLFLMEADELRRNSRSARAGEIYRKVAKRFRDDAEDALWGLGWMHYMSGDYAAASADFSELAKYVKSRNYYKYIYWKAKAGERLFEDCFGAAESDKSKSAGDACNKADADPFSGLPADESYYGYLIRLRSPDNELPDKVELLKPDRPGGDDIKRIEALILLGMNDAAISEIVDSMKRTKTQGVLLYLGYLAMGLDKYRDVIAFAEEKEEREFLPYSYPLGFWDVITDAADSENVDAHLIAALIREESRYDREVISWAGAVGLMQLMPSTANMLKNDMDTKFEDGIELSDARTNILLGTHYFSRLVRDLKELPLAIAAYNAGEKTLADWLSRFDDRDIAEFIENIPYKETRRYVKKVLKSYWQYRTINGLPINRIERRAEVSKKNQG